MIRPCPTCQREVAKSASTAFPFCSARCRTIDLGRWLNEDYRIPVEGSGSGGGDSLTPGTDDER